MILKGSQRSGGANLAVHLMRVDDNEHVELHELRGFAGETLKEAFQEADAVSRGTRCRQYLFSLSLNPPQDANPATADFEAAIDRVEAQLGLTGQPRAIVFHEKEGRRHAHCVWSRIDAATMTAKPLPFFKTRLGEVSRELYRQHGWEMPRGLIDAANRNPANFTLAEWQQAKRHGLDPRDIRECVQMCWKASDNTASFSKALEEHGLRLAKGDRRGFVVLDYTGEVYALPRLLDVKTKEVRDRLGDGQNLKSVDAARQALADTMRPAIKRHIADSKDRFSDRSAKLGAEKIAMTQRHRVGRKELDDRLEQERIAEARKRAASLPRGLASLWSRMTGDYKQRLAKIESEAKAQAARHAAAREALIAVQRAERAPLQARFKDLRKAQAETLLSLRADRGRYAKLTRSHDAGGMTRGRDTGLSLKLRR